MPIVKQVWIISAGQVLTIDRPERKECEATALYRCMRSSTLVQVAAHARSCEAAVLGKIVLVWCS